MGETQYHGPSEPTQAACHNPYEPTPYYDIPPVPPPPPKQGHKGLIVALVSVICLIVLFGGGFFTVMYLNTQQHVTQVTPTPTPVPPTATPLPTLPPPTPIPVHTVSYTANDICHLS